ncbi:hypothetical protein GXW84_31005 [Rhodococcus sp. IEGM 248]|nr:hypothetical protein [Rhodococcus sp. IEGM 248]
MTSRSDIVKLSDADLAWLRPGERHGDAIRWSMFRGPATLVVTHGDTAATRYTRKEAPATSCAIEPAALVPLAGPLRLARCRVRAARTSPAPTRMG